MLKRLIPFVLALVSFVALACMGTRPPKNRNRLLIRASEPETKYPSGRNS